MMALVRRAAVPLQVIRTGNPGHLQGYPTTPLFILIIFISFSCSFSHSKPSHVPLFVRYKFMASLHQLLLDTLYVNISI